MSKLGWLLRAPLFSLCLSGCVGAESAPPFEPGEGSTAVAAPDAGPGGDGGIVFMRQEPDAPSVEGDASPIVEGDAGLGVEGTGDGGSPSPDAEKPAVDAGVPMMEVDARAPAACGAGTVATDAGCTPGCVISGVFYEPGMTNPENLCQTCQPSASTTSFSDADGMGCGGGYSTCQGGFCG